MSDRETNKQHSRKTCKMEVEVTLISKGIKVSKICTTEKMIYRFEQDMLAKYNLLFNKTIPFLIGHKYLDNE